MSTEHIPHSIHCRGYRGVGEEFDVTACDCGALFRMYEAEKAENERLREGIRYWSYCTSQGMIRGCPEEVEKLADFMISCRIAPWYIRTRTLETVKADRS